MDIDVLLRGNHPVAVLLLSRQYLLFPVRLIQSLLVLAALAAHPGGLQVPPTLGLAEVILFLAQLPQLAVAVAVLLLVRRRQVGQEAVLVAPLLQARLGQLGRDIKVEIRQMEVVAVAVQALLEVMELHHSQQVELLEQVAQALHLL